MITVESFPVKILISYEKIFKEYPYFTPIYVVDSKVKASLNKQNTGLGGSVLDIVLEIYIFMCNNYILFNFSYSNCNCSIRFRPSSRA